MKPIAFVVGTRPEIIKLAPLLRRAVAQKINFQLVHTHQHYDYALDQVFFDELKLPAPTHRLQVASTSSIDMLQKIIAGCTIVWQQDRPSVVVVQGDTNTVFGAAFAAHTMGIPVAHVEAGLRSGDLGMPEEINRILTDRIAARLYAPTAAQRQRLIDEGIDGSRIVITGNSVLDAVQEHRTLAEGVAFPSALVALKKYVPITLHRPSLVDHPALLQSVLERIATVCGHEGLTGVFLAHPRARKALNAFNVPFTSPHILIHEPVGYLPMLKLLSGAACVLTDSGGLQEETAILHIKCITLRTTTERPETLAAGGNVLVFPTDPKLPEVLTELLAKTINWKPLYEVANPSDAMITDLLSHYA